MLTASAALALAGDARASPLHVSGSVRGLYPGASTAMHVQLRNDSRRRLRVRWVDARPRQGVPGCPRRLVVVQPSRRDALLEPRSARTVTMRVGLRREAPDACQGATFPLRLLARARVLAASTPPVSGGDADQPGGSLPLTGAQLALLALVGTASLTGGTILRRRRA